jgi:trehalose 6-phosphate synthase
MGHAARVAAMLVLGLALLTWVASTVVHRTTRAWSDKDLALRARLAVSGPARTALIARWDGERRPELAPLLEEVTHDERIMAAAACGADLEFRARTDGFPPQLACDALASRFASTDTSELAPAHWTTDLPGGEVHLSAIPLVEGGRYRGFVALVHDLSFVQRREAETRRLLLYAFGVLALAAAATTLGAARLAWRAWSRELRASLAGSEQPRPAFKPIMRDVRELVDRLASDHEADRDGGAWTPARLKQTLARHLQGERIAILANREPYIHERGGDGRVKVVHPASGLVTALEPIMRACSGTWIAHGSGSADREMVDQRDRVRVPPGEESYAIRRVWLTPKEETGYYYGFSNEGLWPLCHIAHTRPIFRTEDWQQYQRVNQRFADAVCDEVDLDDPIVLVQDYHFALAPRLIRERLPRATIIMFWHIPWPNSQRFGICPWREELLEGMLGSSILGFHTQADCNNLVESVDRYLEARIDREQVAVVHHRRSTLVRAYPISIDWPNRWLDTAPSVEEARASVVAEHGLAPDAMIGLGVDRLDYTKGVEERLLTVERLLERSPALRGRFTFVQLAAPSRAIIERYRQLNESVEALAERINRRFGAGTYRPIVLSRAHHEPPTVFRYYRAADVCYVSSLHDGMNLVAKEFVAARDDEQGVLVLSQFTGAARELTEALVVNPYDLDEASAALSAALAMSPAEQRERMRAMRSFVSEFNVYRWGGRMLVDAAKLRRRERLTDRLADHMAITSGAA